jgi:hypothetical protein
MAGFKAKRGTENRSLDPCKINHLTRMECDNVRYHRQDLCYGAEAMTTPDPRDVFFLIVADLDRGLFCVEGPMSDDAPWHVAADRASAARPAQIATRWPASTSRRTRWRAFHRAAS